jgi:heparin binding hemagglutinin HbhA
MTANTTTKTTTRKIPNPLYAAAGAGDIAYERLRKLPEQVAQLRARVEEIRPAVSDAVSENNLRDDLNRLRGVARRNAASILASAQAGAQVAQDRAFAVYTDLVARGEKVVSTARGAEARIEIEPAAKTVTAEVAATEEPPAATGAPTTPAKKTTARKTTAAKK